MECSSRVKRSAVTRYYMAPRVQYSLDSSVRHHKYLPGDIFSIIMHQKLSILCHQHLPSVKQFRKRL